MTTHEYIRCLKGTQRIALRQCGLKDCEKCYDCDKLNCRAFVIGIENAISELSQLEIDMAV